MNRTQHWKLLQNKKDTKTFNSIEKDVLDHLEEFFGFKLSGKIVDKDPRSYGIGFDLKAQKYNTNYQGPLNSQNIFPDYKNREKLSYWCFASRIKNTASGVNIDIFKKDFSFEHHFRFSEGLVPIVLDRIRNNGIYIKKLKDTQPVTMKEVITSDAYIDKVSNGMELADTLIEIE